MNLHYTTCFARDKNLGKAYNETIQHFPDDDWICLYDGDICFLYTYYGNQIEDHINERPGAGIFTCYTNRIGYIPDGARRTLDICDNSLIRVKLYRGNASARENLLLPVRFNRGS